MIAQLQNSFDGGLKKTVFNFHLLRAHFPTKHIDDDDDHDDDVGSMMVAPATNQHSAMSIVVNSFTTSTKIYFISS